MPRSIEVIVKAGASDGQVWIFGPEDTRAVTPAYARELGLALIVAAARAEEQ